MVVCEGWDKPSFPVPAAWLETPEKVKQRAAEALELSQGLLQCADRRVAPQLMLAAYSHPDPHLAAPTVKSLSELEGEDTWARWKELGGDLERVQAWLALRGGRSPEETRELLRLADVPVGKATLQDRAGLLSRHQPEDYIRQVCTRYSEQPEVDKKRLTSVWLLGDESVGTHGLKQEGEVLMVGGVRLRVAKARPSDGENLSAPQ